jgi:hypothetical protein
MIKVMFYDYEDFIIFETDAKFDDLIEWAKRYNEVGCLSADLKKPNNCSTFDLIFDTEIDLREETMEVNFKINLNKLGGKENETTIL